MKGFPLIYDSALNAAIKFKRFQTPCYVDAASLRFQRVHMCRRLTAVLTDTQSTLSNYYNIVTNNAAHHQNVLVDVRVQPIMHYNIPCAVVVSVGGRVPPILL